MALQASYTLAVVSLINWGIFQLALIQQFLTLFIYFFQNCITKRWGGADSGWNTPSNACRRRGCCQYGRRLRTAPKWLGMEFKITVGIYGYL